MNFPSGRRGTIILSRQDPDTRKGQTGNVGAPTVVLTHARVIDGTGSAPREEQTIVITGGKIQSVESGATAKTPANARALDLTGYSDTIRRS